MGNTITVRAEFDMGPVDDLMQAALSDSVFPGAVLLVARADAVLFFEAYGYANLYTRQPMGCDTLFDLASLTKPLATTLAVMELVRCAKLELTARLAEILPVFRNTDKASITIRQLLSHTSGYPDYRPYYIELTPLPPNRRRAKLREFLVQEPLVHSIGSRTLYSDLGFMALSWVVETCSGMRMDQYLEETVYRPLGLHTLSFVDLESKQSGASAAATEFCPWRNRLADGVVHDENAYAAGGIEGHAGLFGTAHDLFRLLTLLLSVYKGDRKNERFRTDLVRRFFSLDGDSGRALGFDVPAPEGSSCGNLFSRHTVGHLGFTGTSFWMDLERGILVVLLTNRVHPTRKNEKIKTFRPQIHNIVMTQIGVQN